MNSKLFILAEARSGSSWLMETLNSHKDITLMTELYNHGMFEEVLSLRQDCRTELHSGIRYLDDQLSAISNRYIGCKILLNQLKYISPDFPEYFIRHYRQANFIFLSRENIIKSMISLKMAHTTKIWHFKEGDKIIRRKICIDPVELIKKADRSQSLKNKVLKNLAEFNVRKFETTYEELFENPAMVIEKICSFLDLTNENIKYSEEVKGSPVDLEKVIANFHEVKDYLKEYSVYSEMLSQKHQ